MTSRRIRGVISGALWPDLPVDLSGRTVVCHEWLVTIGGSDKVTAELAAELDVDYVFTLAAEPSTIDQLGLKVPVIESRLGPLMRRGRRWELFLPVMPILWAVLDLREARLVVTNSHAFVNFVRAPRDAKLSYCNTPMRYAWEWRLEAARIPRLVRPFWPVVARVLQLLDRFASRSVTRYVGNSAYVVARIKRYYRRDAVVVWPPVDLEWWTPEPGARGDFVLVAGRMVGYKRPQLAVAAAGRAGLPVVVAGSGPALEEIRRGDAVVVVIEDPSDEQLRQLYRQCLMFAFPPIEDFGMMPIEAQACGAPVVGIAAGGSLETVRDGVTGRLVVEQTTNAMAEAMRAIADAPFEVLPSATEPFGRGRFARELRRVVADMGVP